MPHGKGGGGFGDWRRRLRLGRLRRRLDFLRRWVEEQRQEVLEERCLLGWERRNFEQMKAGWKQQLRDGAWQEGWTAAIGWARFDGDGDGGRRPPRPPPAVPVDTPARCSIVD